MGEPSPSAALNALGEVYRGRQTGILTLGEAEDRIAIAIRDGHVVGILPPDDPAWKSASLRAKPDDSARMKLERVLAEIGLKPGRTAARAKAPAPAGDLRARLLTALSDPSTPARFEEQEELPDDLSPSGGTTEPLMLEAVRLVRRAEQVHELLGDLDQRLVTTSAFATEERTLTLTEGYILSRIDGQCTTRQVLQMVPLDPDDTERSLLGLILTGRVKAEAVVAKKTARHAAEAQPEPPTETQGRSSEESEHIPLELPLTDPPPPDEPTVTEAARSEPRDEPEKLDPELLARRREILEVFQALPLRNHFEVLGLEPGCTDADVRRAHVAYVKRYHPDMQRDARLEDLHDVLEAIFIRVGEAWEVLGNGKSRAAYEARLGVKPRVITNPAAAPQAGVTEPPAATELDAELEYSSKLSSEDLLVHAKRLIRGERYWEAIRLLEAALPRLQPRRQEHRGRILLARAYAQNPNWKRKAEETLQDVVREDPANADAHYELGVLYKARGATARAHAMFKKVVELKPDHRAAAAEIGAPAPPAGSLFHRLFKRGGGS